MTVNLANSIVASEKILGISHAKIYEEINSGRLKSYRVGTRRFISDRALQNYVQDREAEEAQGGEV